MWESQLGKRTRGPFDRWTKKFCWQKGEIGKWFRRAVQAFTPPPPHPCYMPKSHGSNKKLDRLLHEWAPLWSSKAILHYRAPLPFGPSATTGAPWHHTQATLGLGTISSNFASFATRAILPYEGPSAQYAVGLFALKTRLLKGFICPMDSSSQTVHLP